MSTVARTDALELLEATRPVIERISADVWDHAELSLEEVRSAEVHVRELEAAGFTVETGTSGFGTAFVAERRFGDGPVVGFLSEYDALPGLGNAAVPRQEPRTDGNTNGHGCGHNLLGAALTGAAIGLKGAIGAAQVLALTALDVVTDTELRDAARADFHRRTEGFEYVSPIPEGQTRPRGYRLPASAP